MHCSLCLQRPAAGVVALVGASLVVLVYLGRRRRAAVVVPEAPWLERTLQVVPWSQLRHVKSLGEGHFGAVDLMEWAERGLQVAVKRNGTEDGDVTALNNERALYERLLVHPHDNVLPVYGVCTDAPGGGVRLIVRHCPGGSLSEWLVGQEVRTTTVYSVHQLVLVMRNA